MFSQKYSGVQLCLQSMRLKSDSKELNINLLTSKIMKKRLRVILKFIYVKKKFLNRHLEIGRVFLEAFVEKSGPKHAYEKTFAFSRWPSVRIQRYERTSLFFNFSTKSELNELANLLSCGDYYHPLDARLNLPQSKYSYLLQKWLQISAGRNQLP